MLEIDFGARRINSAFGWDRRGFDGDILRRHTGIGQCHGNRLRSIKRQREPRDGGVFTRRFAKADDADGPAPGIVSLAISAIVPRNVSERAAEPGAKLTSATRWEMPGR